MVLALGWAWQGVGALVPALVLAQAGRAMHLSMCSESSDRLIMLPALCCTPEVHVQLAVTSARSEAHCFSYG